MTFPLDALIRQACTELGSDACRTGNHDWITIGGRVCPHPEGIGEGVCSQAVYECRVCGETDYGYKGGPGYDDCNKCQYKYLASDLTWWTATPTNGALT
jgi:hypothetical protein